MTDEHTITNIRISALQFTLEMARSIANKETIADPKALVEVAKMVEHFIVTGELEQEKVATAPNAND